VSFHTSSRVQGLGLWIGGALLAIGLSACSGQLNESSSDRSEPGSGVIAGGTTPLAADLASAPWQVAYHGVRRLDFLSSNPAVSYREKVSADGLGRYGIHVTELLTAHHDAPGFIARQAQNQGFNYRYRGFRVLEPFQFELNYTVQLLNQGQVVAGVACTRLLVQKRFAITEAEPSHYLVDMDMDSGLVLGWQELSSDGGLIARMEFESFALGLAEIPIPMSSGSMLETEIAIEDLSGPKVPFDVLRPRLLPSKYRLFRAYQVDDGAQNTWMRQVFTDGQGSLIFMHRKQVLQAGGSVGTSTLGVYEEDQWTVLMGDVNGHSLLAVGKFGANELQDFVSSCFQ